MRCINIAGAGLSGLSAAITLAKAGTVCNLISAQPSERAQSVLAEGGINGALNLMGEDDSPREHFADTMRGGADLADPGAVADMTVQAPEIIRWLSSLGVPFNMDGGRMIQRNFGGQKKKRTAYARSSTGKILMSALIDETRRYEAAGLIRRYSHHSVLDLDIREGACAGLTALDSYTGELLRFSGPVILCAGGMNGMFPGRTTGTTANTGDVTALALEKGVELANLEFIQYHPTTVQIPNKRLLISEAARGEGGRLYILREGAPWYFMEELYPELGNLMPRDVISREMVHVCARPDCGDQVYLNLTGLPKETWEKKLPDLREEIQHYLHLDPAREPVPVSPGIHFFMGGILVDRAHQTNVSGLYAAGECACQYHGANRLGGNSMLGAVYGGRVAAETALSRELSGGEPEALGKIPPKMMSEQQVSPEQSAALCEYLLHGLGILRSAETIQEALDAAEGLLAADNTPLERRRIQLGRAMLCSALSRQESRGAHSRTDFPVRDDGAFQKTTVVCMEAGRLKVEFRANPGRSEDR